MNPPPYWKCERDVKTQTSAPSAQTAQPYSPVKRNSACQAPLCDVLGVERGSRNDLPCDRQCRHANSIRFQIGAKHGGGGSKGCFAEGNRGERRDRIIGEPATRYDDGSGAGRPHGWGGDLRHDDGADDVNRIGRLQEFRRLSGAPITAL
jgi:hypothetical protein